MDTFLECEEAKKDFEEESGIHKFRQLLVASAGFVWGIFAGAIFGYSSIIFVQLRDDPSFEITPEQESWTAAIVSLAMIPATLSIGWTLEKFGRRYMAVFSEVVNLAGWIFCYYARSYHMLLTGRLLGGIYNGIAYPLYVTYIGEITSPKYRAFCITLAPVGGAIGILVTQFLGNYLQWNTVALVFGILPFYNLAVIYYVRESYIWYINKNQIKRAQEYFVWFKGNSKEAKEEFAKAVADVTQEQGYSFRNLFSLMTKRMFAVPFGITNVTYATNQFCGTLALMFYTSIIIEMITTNDNYQYYTNILLNLGRLVGVIISSLLVKRIAVRKVLISGTYVLGLVLVAQSMFLFLSLKYPENQGLVIASLLCLILNVLFFSIALNPLVTVVCGELYPGPVRGIGCSMSATMSAVYLFMVVKAMPLMLATLGGALTFLIFGAFTLTGITITYFILPNTKNKTLKEIENMLAHRID